MCLPAAEPGANLAHWFMDGAGGRCCATGTISMRGRPSGVGKTHLIAGIGHGLIERGYRVLFVRTSDLVQRLQAARRDLRLAINLEFVCAKCAARTPYGLYRTWKAPCGKGTHQCLGGKGVNDRPVTNMLRINSGGYANAQIGLALFRYELPLRPIM